MIRLTVSKGVGVLGWPVVPGDKRLADGGVRCEVNDGDVLNWVSIPSNINYCADTYGVAWSVAGDKVDVEGNDLSSSDVHEEVHVILPLVSTAHEGIALVVGVGNCHGVLDGSGKIAVELIGDCSTAELFLLRSGLSIKSQFGAGMIQRSDPGLTVRGSGVWTTPWPQTPVTRAAMTA